MTDERTLEITTHCSDCVFSQIEEGVQIGCELNRVHKFVDQGKATLNEEGIPIAYVINTVCSAKRPADWANRFENPIERVKKETQVPLDWLVVHTKDSLDDLYFSLKELKKHTIKPRGVVFLVKTKKGKGLKKFLTDAENTLSDSTVLVSRMIEDASDRRMLDIGVTKLNRRGPFYCSVKSGRPIPEDLNDRLNEFINTDLMTPHLVLSSDSTYHCNVVSTMLHGLVGGNKESIVTYNERETRVDDIEDKIILLAKEQDAEGDFVFLWSQV